MTPTSAWLLVALAIVGCRGATEPPTRPAASSTAQGDDAAPSFARGRLDEHFAKHGAELGITTKHEYLARARALVRGGPGVDTLRQRDGDTCYFRDATGEFAVLSASGVLRTYFRPNDGRRYFERQRDR